MLEIYGEWFHCHPGYAYGNKEKNEKEITVLS